MKLATKPEVFYPNDPFLEDQWYLNTIGVFNGEENYGAWDLTTGAANVTIAVLDAGLQWDLDEFGPVNDNLDVVYHNSGEDEWSSWDYPQSGNNQDDDNNGLIDDLKGWDYKHIEQNNGNTFSFDNDVRPNHHDFFHGTSVIGVIAAKTNDDETIAGIAGGDAANNEPGVKILPIKIVDMYYNYYFQKWEEWLSTADVELAIIYATDKGVKVINMSFSCGYGPKENLLYEVQYAYDHNVTLVAAAGNAGDEGYDYISYPASMEHVIAAGATDEDDLRAGFSQIGDELDFTAPGVDITVLDNDGYDNIVSGTSLSAPIISATIGLMLSVNPDLTNDEIETILQNTAEKVGQYQYVNGWNKYYGYGRINAYAAVCAALEEKSAIDVTSNETWDNRVLSKKNITIEPGVTLTVEGEVYMGENTKIIVKPGAKLIVDHGIISNFPFCGEENNRWSGIEVWGDPTEHQMTINGSNAQGMLVLNSATIENAVCAVRLFDYYNTSTTTGGIVIAKNSNFVNNNRAVSFFPFKNIYMDDEFDYISHFTNCTFIVDEDYISSYHTFEGEHISIYGVKGIKFFGCTFINNLDSDPSGNAINTLDAGFRVDGFCTNDQVSPCPEYQNSVFRNFKKAINASNSGNTLYFPRIQNSDFYSNGFGIQLSNVNDAVVSENNFVLGTLDGCQFSYSKGIYLDNCKRFAVEDNEFSLQNPPAAIINTGIQINNTNNKSDQIYRNKFDNMLFGNFTTGKNWNSDKIFGLAYYCNENMSNEYDFYVDNIVTLDDGIQKYQGSRDLAAGNTFSDAATGHFFNYGAYEIGYYYNSNAQNEVPDANKLYRVSPFATNLSNYCPSHYGGGDIQLSSVQVQQRQIVYSDALENYAISKTHYDSIGSMGDSGLRQLYAEQMSYYTSIYSNAAYDIMKSSLADSVVHETTIEEWLIELDSYAADESRIDLYFQQADYSNAMALLDSLQLNYQFSTYDSLEYSHYRTLKTLQFEWLYAGKYVTDIASGVLNQLEYIAENSSGSAGAQARGILEFLKPDFYSFVDCISLPDTTHLKSESIIIDWGENEEDGLLMVSVKPNPAAHYVEISYTSVEELNTGNIKIWASNGSLTYTANLKSKEGVEKIDVGSWQPGMYFYSLTDGINIKNGKFIINH